MASAVDGTRLFGYQYVSDVPVFRYGGLHCGVVVDKVRLCPRAVMGSYLANVRVVGCASVVEKGSVLVFGVGC